MGVKKVDLGGISRPSSAVRLISATVTGRIRTPAAARPGHDLGHQRDIVLVGDLVFDRRQGVFESCAIEIAHPDESVGSRFEEESGPVGSDEHERASPFHLGGDSRLDRVAG